MAKLEPVNVYLRIRDEEHQSHHNVVEVLSDREIQLKYQHPKRFGFNRVFTQKSGQAVIYQSVVAPLVEKAINGFTCTLLTYGQSGSGKTYTLFGNLSNHTNVGKENSSDGCITRALISIFDEMKKLNKNVERSVRVSYLELHNEEMTDLLFDNSEPPKPLRVLEDSEQKGTMYIQNLSAQTVCDVGDIQKIFAAAEKNRQNSSALVNCEDGLSHKVFIVNVYTRIVVVPGEEHLKSGKIIFVDTAGCENLRKAKGSRKGNTINQSLVTLTNAVKALEEKSQYVPLSESKLTKILRESFRGRSKTSIIATISLQRNDVEDTLSTLTFAKGARTIKNPVEMNKVTTVSNVLNSLYAELRKLQKDLTALRSSTGFYVNAENYNDIIKQTSVKEKELNEKLKQITDMEEKIKDLEMEKIYREKEWESVTKSFETTRSRAILYKTNLLKRETHLESVKVAVDATQAAGEPILEQNKELKSVLEMTATNYKIFQNKVESAQKKILHNNALEQDFRETLLNTCSNVVQNLQQHKDDLYETITNSTCDIVDTAELLQKESRTICDQSKVTFNELKTVLSSDSVDKAKRNVQNTFQSFNNAIQKRFDVLECDKQQFQKQLQLLKNNLQRDVVKFKEFNKKQLESAHLLENVNTATLQSIQSQTAAVKQLSETAKTFQVDIAVKDNIPQKHETLDEVIRKLQAVKKLQQQEETTNNNLNNITEKLQSVAANREKILAEDAAAVLKSSECIKECIQMIEEENASLPPAALEDVCKPDVLKKQILDVERELEEDVCSLKKPTKKEEMCKKIESHLKFFEEDVELTESLKEEITSEMMVFFNHLEELQKRKDAMSSDIIAKINGLTEIVNGLCDRKIEDGHVLSSIENKDVCAKQQDLLSDDSQFSDQIQKLLDKLDKFN